MEEQKTEAKSVMSYFIGLETPGKRTICFETKNITLKRALERLEKKVSIIGRNSAKDGCRNCMITSKEILDDLRMISIFNFCFRFQDKTTRGFEETTSSYRDVYCPCNCSSREIRTTAETSAKTSTKSRTKSQA